MDERTAKAIDGLGLLHGPASAIGFRITVTMAIAELRRLSAEVERLTPMAQKLHGMHAWVGPCVHGIVPWTRCDECDEGDAVDGLLLVVAALQITAYDYSRAAENAGAMLRAIAVKPGRSSSAEITAALHRWGLAGTPLRDATPPAACFPHDGTGSEVES